MQVAWEHEQFSRLRVTAATLSALSVAPDLLENTGSLSDNRWIVETLPLFLFIYTNGNRKSSDIYLVCFFIREFVSEAAVVKSVKLVAESLAVRLLKYYYYYY